MSAESSSATPPAKRRRWYQFRLRTLIVCLVLVSTLFGIVSVWIERGRRQASAVATIRKYGGNVTYDYMSSHHPDGSISYARQADSSVPAWLIQRLGVDCFHDIVSVDAQSGSYQSVWDAIGYFPNVTSLQVIGHQPPTDLSSLSTLHRLRSLSIYGDILRGEDLRHLQNCKELEHLAVAFSSFDDGGFQYLKKLPKLTTLNLQYTAVGDEGLAQLVNCPSVQHLLLVRSTVTDDGLKHLNSLPKVVGLSLSETSITDDGILLLCEARGLRTLSLARTSVTDKGLANIAMLDRLEELDLSGTQVTGESVRWPESLVRVDLRFSRLTDKGLQSFIKTRGLRIMVRGTMISDDAVERIQAEHPELALDGG